MKNFILGLPSKFWDWVCSVTQWHLTYLYGTLWYIFVRVVQNKSKEPATISLHWIVHKIWLELLTHQRPYRYLTDLGHFFNVNTFLKLVSTSKSRVTYDLDTDTTTHKIIGEVGSPLYLAMPVSTALPKSHLSLLNLANSCFWSDWIFA